MKHLYHFTLASNNAKTGPIPVTTSSMSTCPSVCPLKGNGCYAEAGPLAWHWKAVSDGRRGISLGDVCARIAALPKHQLWRWAQAGDLPGDGKLIDWKDLKQIVKANTGRDGFTFTHYDPTIDANAAAIHNANMAGFTVNMSANNLEHADQLHALGIGPVVVVLPIGVTKPLKTPAGNHVSVCPAVVRDDMTCARCGICAKEYRRAIVGFPAHGSSAAKAHKVFFMKGVTTTVTHEDRSVSEVVEPRKIAKRKRT